MIKLKNIAYCTFVITLHSFGMEISRPNGEKITLVKELIPLTIQNFNCSTMHNWKLTCKANNENYHYWMIKDEVLETENPFIYTNGLIYFASNPLQTDNFNHFVAHKSKKNGENEREALLDSLELKDCSLEDCYQDPTIIPKARPAGWFELLATPSKPSSDKRFEQFRFKQCLFINHFIIKMMRTTELINILDARGETPLYATTLLDDITTLKTLLTIKHLDPNKQKSVNGNIALHIACVENKFSFIQELLKHPKIDLNIKNNNGHTPLSIACLSPAFGPRNNIAIITLLLKDPKINPNITPALHYAYQHNDTDVIKVLLACSKTNLNITNGQGRTVIHQLCETGQTDLVKLFIQKGCLVNIPDNYGYLPIHYACQNGHLKIVQLLLTMNNDLTAKTDNDNTSYDLAEINGHRAIVELLNSRTEKQPEITEPPCYSYKARIAQLILAMSVVAYLYHYCMSHSINYSFFLI